MQQVQFFGGTVWGELDTARHHPHDPRPAPERPGSTATALPTRDMPPPLRQGYVSVARNDLLYPALQVAPSGEQRWS